MTNIQNLLINACMSVLNNIAVILVQPQMGENIGAAARAMANFGLSDLRLVAPRDGWPSDKAEAMAAGALAAMKPVQVFETLEDAVADLNYVMATTARPRDMVKPVFTAQGAAQEWLRRARDNQTIGLVFGAERAGLTNDHIALCSSIITIPTSADFSSINLGQTVLLVAYEFLQAQSDTPACTMDHGDSEPVSQEKLEEFVKRLEDELETGGFFRSEGLKPTIRRSIRAMFTRADLSDQEIRTLHGIISALIKK